MTRQHRETLEPLAWIVTLFAAAIMVRGLLT